MNRVMLQTVVLIQKIFSKVAYFLGPVCVVFAIGLIFLVSFVYFTAILPYYMYDGVYSIISLFHLSWSLWAAFNILFNYFYCISTSPGYTKDYYNKDYVLPQREKDEDEIGNIFDIFDLDEDEKMCYQCNKPKPPRCHHCSICNQCVLRMDHHCPWMANCVGHFNYKYFVLFLVYITLGCLYVCILCVLPVQYGGVPKTISVPYFGRAAFNFVMLLTGTISLATGSMGIWHLFLIVTQQTTIEFYQNSVKKREAARRNIEWVNVYNINLKSNFESVFGSNTYPYKWLLPSTRKPPSDGVNYTVKFVNYPEYNI